MLLDSTQVKAHSYAAAAIAARDTAGRRVCSAAALIAFERQLAQEFFSGEVCLFGRLPSGMIFAAT
jgi:hypothetical protein